MKQPLSDIEPTTTALAARDDLVSPLGLPARSRAFYQSMGSVYMVGAGMLAGAGVALGSVLTGAMWGMAIGAFGLLLLGGARAPERNQKLLQKLDQVRSERAKRIMQLFRVLDFPPTVEQIATRLRWKENAVIDGLRELVESGAVIEDIHFETGEWTYALPGTRAAVIQAAGSTDSLSLQIEYAYDEALHAEVSKPSDSSADGSDVSAASEEEAAENEAAENEAEEEARAVERFAETRR